MVTFEVNDMTCRHCVGSLTQAVHAIDPGAQITFDLATHRVRIEPTESSPAELGAAIVEAGYSPVEIRDGATSAERPATRSGCCCR